MNSHQACLVLETLFYNFGEMIITSQSQPVVEINYVHVYGSHNFFINFEGTEVLNNECPTGLMFKTLF
jgi:hypothetical protein